MNWNGNPEALRRLLSVPDVCEAETFASAASDGGRPERVDLLLEAPHGATRTADYEAVRRRLRGALPRDLEDFFHVNTDVGSAECARAAAELFARPEDDPELAGRLGADALDRLRRRPRLALVLRSRIPRTFIDCNRTELGSNGMTPLLPPYVEDADDRAWLLSLWNAYQETAARAFAVACARGGVGIPVHTYAPRSVGIETIDAGIVEALHRAYAPDVYPSWPLRPEVDLIVDDLDGRRWAPADLLDAVAAEYRDLGVEVALSQTYRLHPATAGYVHARRYPDRVLTLEIRRDLLADPFEPFREMRIDAARARRLARPLAWSALRRWIADTAGVRR